MSILIALMAVTATSLCAFRAGAARAPAAAPPVTSTRPTKAENPFRIAREERERNA